MFKFASLAIVAASASAILTTSKPRKNVNDDQSPGGGDDFDYEDPAQWVDIINALKEVLGCEDNYLFDVTDLNAFVFLALRADYIDDAVAAVILTFFGNVVSKIGAVVTVRQFYDEIESLFDD